MKKCQTFSQSSLASFQNHYLPPHQHNSCKGGNSDSQAFITEDFVDN